MNFGQDDFELLQSSLGTDFGDFYDSPSVLKIRDLDKKFEAIEKSRGAPTTRAFRSVTLGAFDSVKLHSYHDVIGEQLKLDRAPEKMWMAFNTLAILAPERVPNDVIVNINKRKRALDAVTKQIRDLTIDPSSNKPIDTVDIEAVSNLLEEKRQLEESFLKDVDQNYVKLALAVDDSTRFEERYKSSFDEKLGSVADETADWYKAASTTFNFFKNGTDLRSAVEGVLNTFTSLHDRYFQRLAKGIKSGTFAKNPVIARILKRTSMPKWSGKFFKMLGEIGSKIFMQISKLAGPLGTAVAVLVAIGNFFLSQQKERAEFNANLLQTVGLVNIYRSMDFGVGNVKERADSFYTTVFDYFNSQSSKFSTTLSDGSTVKLNENTIDLGLNAEKYMEMLSPLVQAGTTIEDIESEFGRVSIDNAFNGQRLDSITNFRSPLEALYVTAKVFNMDPADLAKAAGDYQFSFGDLLTTTNHAFQQMYLDAQAGGVKGTAFLDAVNDLSASYGYFSSQASNLSSKLGSLLKRKALSLDQARHILEGTLQELLGYNNREMMNILHTAFMTDGKFKKQEFSQFIEAARTATKQSLANAQAELASGNEANRAATEAKILSYKVLLKNLNALEEQVNSGNIRQASIASVIQETLGLFPTLAVNLGAIATQSAFQAINRHSLRGKNLSPEEMAEVQLSNTAYGRPEIATEAAIQSRMENAARFSVPELEKLDPARLEAYMTETAIQMTRKTESFADQLDNVKRDLGYKIYTAVTGFMASIRKFIKGANAATGSDIASLDKKPQNNLNLSGILSSINKNLFAPLSGGQGELEKQSKLIIKESPTDFNFAVHQKNTEKSGPTSHFFIDREGKIYQTAPLGTPIGGSKRNEIVIELAQPDALAKKGEKIRDPRHYSLALLAQGLAQIASQQEKIIAGVSVLGSRISPNLQNAGDIADAAIRVGFKKLSTYDSISALTAPLTANKVLRELFQKAFNRADKNMLTYEEYIETLTAYVSNLEDNELESSLTNNNYLKQLQHVLGLNVDLPVLRATLQKILERRKALAVLNNDDVFKARLESMEGFSKDLKERQSLAELGILEQSEYFELADAGFRANYKDILKNHAMLITEEEVEVFVSPKFNSGTFKRALAGKNYKLFEDLS